MPQNSGRLAGSVGDLRPVTSSLMLGVEPIFFKRGGNAHKLSVAHLLSCAPMPARTGSIPLTHPPLPPLSLLICKRSDFLSGSGQPEERREPACLGRENLYFTAICDV